MVKGREGWPRERWPGVARGNPARPEGRSPGTVEEREPQPDCVSESRATRAAYSSCVISPALRLDLRVCKAIPVLLRLASTCGSGTSGTRNAEGCFGAALRPRSPRSADNFADNELQLDWTRGAIVTISYFLELGASGTSSEIREVGGADDAWT